ncbi:MAG TPA: bifunctional UDP-sugar hydrolase/5'-nucleotidase [bacterium]|nr:bifunctional UDP-sugar hydrolase/5'-nucleotidase [bacterium]
MSRRLWSRPTVWTAVALILLALVVSCGCSLTGTGRHYRAGTITVLETNDVHSHLFPWTYKPKSSTAVKVGGLARIATVVSQVRERERNVLLLDAGDIFYPYSLNRWRARPEIGAMNLIGYDCSAVGNHEFDLGDGQLGEALDLAEFPFLSANMDVSQSLPLAGKVQSYVIKSVGGHTVGIFGLITPNLHDISSPSKQVKVDSDLVAKVVEMVSYLRPRADLVFALTHIGLRQDVKLARSVSGIDVIFGGHSHDALEKPIEVTNPAGKRTLIVQSGCYGRFVGKLQLECSPDGIASYQWSLLNVDESVEDDVRVASFLEPFRPADEEQVGIIEADLKLFGAELLATDSTVGTLVCDAIAEQFPTAAVVAVNSGGIRGDFQPAGPITRSRIDEILPFRNQIVLVWVSGSELESMLERSVQALPRPSGGFLQLSGLEVTVRLARRPVLVGREGKPVRPGERIVSVSVGGKPLDERENYLIATIDYLAGGGDGYMELARAKNRILTGKTLNDILADYIKSHSPLHPRRRRAYRFVWDE